ncbi:NSs [Itaporanga virus]|uniref:NSs n=1 Tax=Itaporanga virus TaxID=629735 RepID=A0A4P8D7V6_9VIRU|nr:NSs [Itaporanga virus]QCI62752.1 NSs [Itaporanga virus]
MMRFFHPEMPEYSFDYSKEGGRVNVLYVNKFEWTEVPASYHMGSLIPLKFVSLSRKKFMNLKEFYDRDTLPLLWGDCKGSQVMGPSLNCFDEMIKMLASIPLNDFLAPSRGHTAHGISWPTGSPDLNYIVYSSKDINPESYYSRCHVASMLMNGAKGNPSLDLACVALHKKIRKAAADMGVSPELFSGRNLVKDVACVQVISVLRGAEMDQRVFGKGDNLVDWLVECAARIRTSDPGCLGDEIGFGPRCRAIDDLDRCLEGNDSDFSDDSSDDEAAIAASNLSSVE